MNTRQSVKGIVANEEVHSVFLVGTSSLQKARNGPFWRLELRDATGNVEAKIWSPLSTSFATLPSGIFVEIQGRASLFREQIQINIEQMRILSEEESVALDMSAFLLTSPRSIQEMWDELVLLCKKELHYGPWRNFVLKVLKDETLRTAWQRAPAAKSVHHAYMGGLLEHTLSVTQLVLTLATHYPNLDRQCLLAGAIFHDLGKVWEFSQDLVPDYTDAGKLIGHMGLALEYLQPFLQKSGLEEELIRHFKHLILSHHGTYEFGTARLPQTPEALLLHYADNIDAKMAQCHHIFTDWEDDATGWSAYQKTLGRAMHKPYRTPNTTLPKEKKHKPVEKQCSLPSKV